MKESKTDRYMRRYLHAAHRFRQRYGQALPIEEYAGLCDALAAGGGEGRRGNGERRVEAWVHVAGAHAYAVFDPEEELVVTFLPVPPGSDSMMQARAEIAGLRNQVKQLRSGSKKSRRRAERANVSWFKNQIRSAIGMLMRGQKIDAVCLLNALVSLPASADPMDAPGAVARIMDDLIAQKRAYLAALDVEG